MSCRSRAKKEPSFLLLISSCLLTICDNESTDLFKLFTLFCGCSTLSTELSIRPRRLSLAWQIVISQLIFGLFFEVISSTFSLVGYLDFIIIRIIVGSSIVIASNDLSVRYSPSFTAGELSLLMQGLFSLLAVSFIGTKSIFLDAKIHDVSLPTQVIHLFCQTGFYSIVILKLTCYLRIDSSLVFLMVLSTMLVQLYFFLLIHLLPSEPFIWLIKEALLTDTRVKLMVQWSACLSITIALSICWAKFSHEKASSSQRKLFHLPMFLVFVTGIKNDIHFLSFASACLLILFFIAESIRLSKLSPAAAFIDMIFDAFRDEKDSGPLTLTHCYLLIGCALPVWLSVGAAPHPDLVAACSGVISIGLGDSAASIIGSRWGRSKWPNSKKSFQGTAAAFIAQVIGSVFIFTYLYPLKHLDSFELLVISFTCFLVSLVEALTSEIDNLVLSLYFYIIYRALSYSSNFSLQ